MSMLPPPPPKKGDLVISYLEKLFRYIKRMRVVSGEGIQLKQTEGGITVSVSSDIRSSELLASGTQGDILHYNNNEWEKLPIGVNGEWLSVNSTSDSPEWATIPYNDITSPPVVPEVISDLIAGTTGDIIFHNGTAWVTLAAGSVGDVLVIGSGGLPEWETPDTDCGT